MKRKVIAVLMASVMALSMAACGSGKNDSGSSSDTGSGNDAAKSDAAGDDADAVTRLLPYGHGILTSISMLCRWQRRFMRRHMKVSS